MITLTINNAPVEVPEGSTVLSAAKQAGIRIPTMCHVEGLQTIGAVALSCLLSCIVMRQLLVDHVANFNGTVYTWLVTDGVHMQVGFLIDRLSALMMEVGRLAPVHA